MKKSLKKIISMVSIASVISTTVGSQMAFADDTATTTAKASPSESAGQYATNPKGGVGKEATIKIDGDFSDWSEDMLIAQGAAGDTATRFKGCHENWVMDSYSLYGAWDDENVYIGWQGVNVYDTFWDQDGNGPLSDNGKPGNAPIFIAIDSGKGNAMSGKVIDKGKTSCFWNMNIGFTTRVDAIVAIKSNLEDVGFFKADATGVGDYDASKGLTIAGIALNKAAGIEVKKVDGCFPSKIMGVWNPGDKNSLASYDASADWIDYKVKTADMKREHDTKYDTFYELKVPLAKLGITKDDLEKNGLGVMQIIGRGESGMDCLPHDPSMLDNVYEDYTPDPSSSHEKEDHDEITVPLASIGKVRDPSVIAPPVIAPPVDNTKKDAKISDLKADKTEVKPGDEVKFTCTATDAKSYSFKIDDKDVDASEVKDNVLTHKFDKEGTYKVKVTAKGDSEKEDTKELSVDVKEDGKGDNDDQKVSVKDFKATPNDSVKAGDSVDLSANAEGGKKDYEYKFTSVDKDGKENVIQDFSDKNEATWEPDKEGTYTLNVYAKDKDADDKDAQKKSIEDFKVAAKGNDNADKKLSIDSFEADPDEGTIETNSDVTFKAKASGADGVTYKFEVSKDGEDKKELKLNDAENGASWTPNEEGSYEITLTATKDGYKDATETKSYEVKSKKTTDGDEDKEFNVSITPATIADKTVGDSIELKVAAENASSDVTYKFVVDSLKSKYSDKEFSSKDTFTFKPEEAKDYKVYVIADNGKTQKKSDPVTIHVNDKDLENKASLSMTLPSKKGKVNTDFEIIPELKGLTGKIQYKLYLNDSNEPITLKEKDGKLLWTPDKAGQYNIKIVAENEDNVKATSNEISVNVDDADKKVDTKGEQNNKPTGDNAPLKLLAVLGVAGASVLAFVRKRQK